MGCGRHEMAAFANCHSGSWQMVPVPTTNPHDVKVYTPAAYSETYGTGASRAEVSAEVKAIP